MGLKTSQDMHEQTCSLDLGRQPMHGTNPSTQGMDYSMRHKYASVNAYGAHIYMDPVSRFLIEIVESLTLVQPAPWVEYQGDQCMGKDGTQYVSTMDLENGDLMGQHVGIETTRGG